MKQEILKGIRFNIGKGDNILFWEDVWMGDQALKHAFTDIYHLAPNRLISIADNYYLQGNDIVWNLSIRRNLRDREIEEYAAVLSCISTGKPDQTGMDRSVWKPNKSGSFSVKSLHNLIFGFPDDLEETMMDKMWKYKLPPKIAVFAWLVGGDTPPWSIS
ncbi:uncharacterized protein LOC131230587 [Magnolia sinica]|uniref:uncharacterized protein LOC131230587 n=1 Tax=Magnolia sinica TaxID=86752 RepID=UPI00265AAB1A|nr:uncharacterized protein LOC131230587 [Magnolia sinica]